MARPRSFHYLTPARGGPWPRAGMAVAAYYVERPGASPARPPVDTLVAWAGWRWRWTGRTREPAEHCAGDDGRSLWGWVKNSLRKRECAWLWTMGAARLLSASGLWDQLEDGAWMLTTRGPAGKQPGEEGDWTGEAIVEDPPTILRVRPVKAPGSVRVLCLRNYGVDTWRALEGLPGAFGSLSPAGEIERDGWLPLARERALAVMYWVHGWTELIAERCLGGLMPSSGGQAMHSFRATYVRRPMLVHNCPDALQLERDALHAGRAEAFRIGTAVGPWHHLDYPSAYPQLALTAELPARLRRFRAEPSWDLAAQAAAGWGVIADVQLATDSPDFPARVCARRPDCECACHRFAWRCPAGCEPVLCWPVGRFRTALCWPELQRAWELRAVERVYSAALYEPSPLGAQWSADLMRWRREYASAGQPALAGACKRLANSLWGAWAKRGYKWVSAPNACPGAAYDQWYGRNPQTGEVCRYRSVAWLVMRQDGREESRESCPAITAWLWSLAREQLRLAIDVAGRRRVLLVDTDALWVSPYGRALLDQHGLVGDGAPGLLASKGRADWITVHGPRHYHGDGVAVHSGVPIDHDGTRTDGYHWRTPERPLEALRAGRAPEPNLIDRGALHRALYRGGRVLPSGVVVPWELDQ